MANLLTVRLRAKTDNEKVDSRELIGFIKNVYRILSLKPQIILTYKLIR